MAPAVLKASPGRCAALRGPELYVTPGRIDPYVTPGRIDPYAAPDRPRIRPRRPGHLPRPPGVPRSKG